jgi:hypothetical protein
MTDELAARITSPYGCITYLHLRISVFYNMLNWRATQLGVVSGPVSKQGQVSLSAGRGSHIHGPEEAAPLNGTRADAEAAEAEAGRIHVENLNNYIPAIPDKTILCHIITDSILPIEQRNMLKVSIEQAMNKANRHSERVACLSGANAADPDKYIKDLQDLMDKKASEYRALGYTNARFNVASPSKKLVEKILESGVGAKALAFEPCNSPEFNLGQVEGIMLALRALDSGDLTRLKMAFIILSKSGLSPEQSAMADINEFVKAFSFVLPAAKVEDYDERRRINDLIAANVWQAA